MAIACLGSLTPALSCWIVIFANQPGAPHGLLDTMQQDPTATAEALKFFAWSYAKEDKMVDETRLCADVVADIEKM